MIGFSRSPRVARSWRNCQQQPHHHQQQQQLRVSVQRLVRSYATISPRSFVPIPQTSIPSVYDHPLKRLNARSVLQGAFFANTQAKQAKSSHGDFVTGARLLERLQEVEEQISRVTVFVSKRQGIEKLIVDSELNLKDARVEEIKTGINNGQSIQQVIDFLQDLGEDGKTVIFRLAHQAEASQLPFVAQLLPVYWKTENSHMTYKNAYQSTILILESFMSRGQETEFSHISYEEFNNNWAAPPGPATLAEPATNVQTQPSSQEVKIDGQEAQTSFLTSAERRSLKEPINPETSHLTEQLLTRPVMTESAESRSNQECIEKLVQELKTQYYHSHKENGLLNDRVFGAISKLGSFTNASKIIENSINENSTLPSEESIEIYLDTLKRYLSVKKTVYIGDNFDTYALHKVARLGSVFKSKHVTPSVINFMLPYINDSDGLVSVMTTIRGSWNHVAILNECQEALLDTAARCSNHSVYADDDSASASAESSKFRDSLVMARMFIIAEELESTANTQPSLAFLTKLLNYNVTYNNILGINKCLDMVDKQNILSLDLNNVFEKFPLSNDEGVAREIKSLWLFNKDCVDSSAQLPVITRLKQFVDQNDKKNLAAADEAIKTCQV